MLTRDEALVGVGVLTLVRRGEGLGAISNYTGPIEAAYYESTGDNVNVRDNAGTSAAIKGELMVGDVVHTKPGKIGPIDGHLWAELDDSAFGPGYVAVEYLQPTSKTKVSSGGGFFTEPAVNKPIASNVSMTTTEGGSGGASPTFFDKYGNYILAGAGVLGVGIVGYAVYKGSKKKRR